jgi:aryl-alcohol dehydrogenase-like predicted oxidoreductase
LLRDHPVATIGISVYEPEEIEKLSGCEFELAFQFPFNVLDRRFEQISIPKGKRYARSVFLQGLLATPKGLRLDAPVELLNLQKEYHDRLANHGLEPADVSFVAQNDFMDYFLFGVDSEKHLQDILELEPYEQKDMAILDTLQVNTAEKWLDPRNWS